MAVYIADQFEILPTIPRRTGRQINRAGHPTGNPSQFWQRSMYYPFMDYYITELTARLLVNGGRYQAQYWMPMNLPRLTPVTVDVIQLTLIVSNSVDSNFYRSPELRFV